ncbi:putative WD repeat protein [Gregarina niphandrodes]|uniref:WD repeat protein n=1 Tax=Gregarina niphandrodes TaxID=110365 RepID=A0A023BAY4_GRENI|nr:putative WD repeat protein [Gregarina niphandrodes]EZG78823.1 putative WD repeat protein [Gregarina niphandrodes]|eukprot:XP_011129190.1 putative WD repeat protein [Gregarina niphandrodes]
MSVVYNFTNLLSTAYKGGAVEFGHDGNSVLSPVGNRVSVKDLVSHSNMTMALEMIEDIDFIVPHGEFLFVVDRGGRLSFVNAKTALNLVSVYIGGRATACSLTEDGSVIAVGSLSGGITVWQTPCLKTLWQFSRINEVKPHAGRCKTIRFSPDGQFLLTASLDRTVKISSVYPDRQYIATAFVDLSDEAIAADWSSDMRHVVVACRQGHVIVYDWNPGEPPTDQRNKMRTMQLAPKTGVPSSSRDGVKSEGVNVKSQGVKSQGGKLEEKMAVEGKEEDDFFVDLGPSQRQKRTLEQSSAAEPVEGALLMTSGWWSARRRVRIEPVKGRPSRFTCGDFCRSKQLLVMGNECGQLVTVQVAFGESEDAAMEVARCVVDERSFVSCVRFNSDGEWIATGLPTTSILCVWEWRSETLVLKEAADASGVTSVALQAANVGTAHSAPLLLGASQTLMAAGGHDGRVTIWDTVSGFELKTFWEHTAPVTGLQFTNQQHTLVSCGADGIIKCYELLRMKCFKTISAPAGESGLPIPLGHLSVDLSGELIAATSSASDCQVFLFSLQTGKLVDQFQAHAEPASAIQFSQDVKRPGLVATCSLEGTVCVWDCFGREGKGGAATTLASTGAAAVALSWHPLNAHLLAVSYTGGLVVIWDVEAEEQLKTIEGLRDIEVGREYGQVVSSANDRKWIEDKGNALSKDADPNLCFTRIAFSGNGEFITAIARRSHKVCVYDVERATLATAWKVTHNRSLEGLLRKLNPKNMVEEGVHEAELELSGDEDDEFLRMDKQKGGDLPGTVFGPLARLANRRRLYVNDLAVSTDSKTLLVGTSQGTFCYELNVCLQQSYHARKRHAVYSALTTFAPTHMDLKTNQKSYIKAFQKGNLPKALLAALAINSPLMISEAYRRISPDEIKELAPKLDIQAHVPALLNFIRACLDGRTTASQQATLQQVTDGQVSGSALSMTECHLTWLIMIINSQRHNLERNVDNGRLAAVLRPLLLSVLKELQQRKNLMAQLFSENVYFAEFLIGVGSDN